MTNKWTMADTTIDAAKTLSLAVRRLASSLEMRNHPDIIKVYQQPCKQLTTAFLLTANQLATTMDEKHCQLLIESATIVHSCVLELLSILELQTERPNAPKLWSRVKSVLKLARPSSSFEKLDFLEPPIPISRPKTNLFVKEMNRYLDIVACGQKMLEDPEYTCQNDHGTMDSINVGTELPAIYKELEEELNQLHQSTEQGDFSTSMTSMATLRASQSIPQAIRSTMANIKLFMEPRLSLDRSLDRSTAKLFFSSKKDHQDLSQWKTVTLLLMPPYLLLTPPREINQVIRKFILKEAVFEKPINETRDFVLRLRLADSSVIIIQFRNQNELVEWHGLFSQYMSIY